MSTIILCNYGYGYVWENPNGIDRNEDTVCIVVLVIMKIPFYLYLPVLFNTM